MALFDKTTEEQEAKKETVSETGAVAVKTTAGLKAVLVQPRVSEKAAKSSQSGKYVFTVARAANKVEVKKAVEQSFQVHVVKVNIINSKGKHKNVGRIAGRTSDFKKAVVTLRAGEKIEGATETI